MCIGVAAVRVGTLHTMCVHPTLPGCELMCYTLVWSLAFLVRGLLRKSKTAFRPKAEYLVELVIDIALFVKYFIL